MFEQMALNLPLSSSTTRRFRAGQRLVLNGQLLVAGRVACERFLADARAERLPVELTGQVLGTPELLGTMVAAPSDMVDDLLPSLLAQGVVALLGWGSHSPTVRYALRKYKAVGLVPADRVQPPGTVRDRCVAVYSDLGEMLGASLLEVKGFEVIVLEDAHGGFWQRQETRVAGSKAGLVEKD